MRKIDIFRRTWLCAAGLIIATVAVYWPALHGGFIWDDDIHISANATLRSLHGLWEIWFKPGATCQYYPLSFTGFWLGYQLWGLNTFGYHFLTVFLHGIAAVLLWQVLARLKVPGALLAGAIFAFHPVNVMSVAWMTELKNTLSASLALGTIWAYLRFANFEIGNAENSRARSTSSNAARRFYLLALFLFVLAMFAKTASSFLPVTLFLIVWWQRDRLRRRDLVPLVPLLAIALTMGALTIYVEQHSGGASGKVFNLNMAERVLVSGRSFWFYLGKLVFPYPLTFIYERWHVDPAAAWQYLYPLAAAGLLIGLFLARRSLGKAPFVAAMHFFVSTAMLILFFVLYMTRYTYVSDHWQYFGCMSVIALAASGIAKLFDRSRGRVKILCGAAVAVMLSIFATLTWRQCAMYVDLETLWRTTISRNPSSWFVQSNLGAVLLQQGRIEEAFAHLQRGVEINPVAAETQSGVAAAFLRMGQTEEALLHAQKALALDPNDPDAHGNLGAALLQIGRVDEAVAHLEKTVEIAPNYSEAHSNLGNALLQLGRLNESFAHLQRALAIVPNGLAAHFNFANTLLKMNRPEEALAHLQKVVAMDPNDAEAQNNMAWVLATWPDARIRDGAKAVELAQRADEVSAHRNPVFIATLAAAFAESGRFSEAVSAAQEALQVAGNNPLADEIRAQLALYQSGQAFHAQP